jgi:2-oxoglutarate ferredoxin oxidoreductase subunit gamma
MAKGKNKAVNSTAQVRIGGVGGQGIVLAGRLLGKAASLFDGKEAVCTQSYGPEARGGASRADVIISNEPLDYPYVTKADILAVLFQEAYVRFRDRIAPDGLLLIDTGLVQPYEDEKNVCGLPATQIAKDLGNRMVANIVMLGYLIEKTGVISRESLEQAIRTSMKPQHIDIDLKALDAGISQARGDVAA